MNVICIYMNNIYIYSASNLPFLKELLIKLRFILSSNNHKWINEFLGTPGLWYSFEDVISRLNIKRRYHFIQ